MRVEDAGIRSAGGSGTVRTYELLSIIGSIFATGIAFGAVVIASNASLHGELRTEMQTLRAEVGAEMQGLRTELRTELRKEIADVRGDLRSVEHRLAAVERRQARTEGLLEGLRDAITAQRPEVARESAEATWGRRPEPTSARHDPPP